MSETPALPAQHHLEMLEALTACASDLAQAATMLAKRAAAEGDDKRFRALSAEFRHCYFAVRMGVRLIADLKAGKPVFRVKAEPAEAPERLRAEIAEPPEIERAEWRETERERDRSEPVSLTQFLKALRLAADAAERRQDELHPYIRSTTLPRLRRLLAEAEPPDRKAATATPVLARPPVPRTPERRSPGFDAAPPLRRRDSG